METCVKLELLGRFKDFRDSDNSWISSISSIPYHWQSIPKRSAILVSPPTQPKRDACLVLLRTHESHGETGSTIERFDRQ